MHITAKTINHHADAHTPLAGPTQGVQDTVAAIIQVENVGFQVQALFGLVDRLANSRKKFLAVLQQGDLITFVPKWIALQTRHAC